MARTERVYIRMAADDKSRLESLAERSNMNASQVVRSLVVCAMRDDFPGSSEYRVIVFDRGTAPRMVREMRTWGYHYNQAVHALNRLAYYAERGSLKDGESERLLSKANENLEDVRTAASKLKGAVDEMVGHALVSI
jgi:hypothetical protein